jgi:DNA-binding IclR family transcriptional regulator
MKINRTVNRTIEMLSIIANSPKGLTLAEIVEVLDIPKTSAYDILLTLHHNDMVYLVDEVTKRYVIGPKAYSVGSAFLREFDIVNVANPFLKQICDELGKTGFVGIESNGKVLYLYKYEPENAIITTAKVGTLNDMHTSSLGKSMLAFNDNLEERVSNLSLFKRTSYSITSVDAFMTELLGVRAKGYATDNREGEEHMLCIGAPIFNKDGKVIAAISISGLYSKHIEIDKLGNKVKKTAEHISRRIGYVNELKTHSS